MKLAYYELSSSSKVLEGLQILKDPRSSYNSDWLLSLILKMNLGQTNFKYYCEIDQYELNDFRYEGQALNKAFFFSTLTNKDFYAFLNLFKTRLLFHQLHKTKYLIVSLSLRLSNLLWWICIENRWFSNLLQLTYLKLDFKWKEVQSEK